MRFQYHKNYSVVLFGALLFAQPRSLTLQHAWDLAAQYVAFAVLLYGGIYTINAVTDADSDRLHATKRLRPIAAGVISAPVALGLAGALIGSAYASTLWWEGSTRFWPMYTAFVAVNILYNLGLRRSRARFLIGVTAALRLCLGAMVTGSTIPPVVYAMSAVFMCTVQCLKFRLEASVSPEATPSGSRPTRGAPLEHMFVLAGALLAVAFLWPPPSAGFAPFCVIWLVSMGVFVLLPWVEPRLAPMLMGADIGPTPPPYSSWTLTVMALLQVGDLVGLAKFAMLSAVSGANHLFMPVEDSLLPGILETPLDQAVFIIGHQRSGTTHLHKALNSVLQPDYATMFDIACPSLILRVGLSPFRLLVDAMLATVSSDQHRAASSEEGEEHTWLLHRWRTEALFMLFPSLHMHPNLDTLFRQRVSHSEEDVQYIRRCMQGVVYGRRLWRGSVSDGGRRLYIGKPLGLTLDLTALRQSFPESSFVVCIREPQAAFASWCQLFATISGRQLDDPALRRMTECMYAAYSRPIFLAALALAQSGDPRTHIVSFEDWKQRPAATVASVLAFVGGASIPEGYLNYLIPARSEHHKHKSSSDELIVADNTVREAYSRWQCQHHR